MTKKQIEEEILWKEKEFKETGKKNWTLLDEINALKEQLKKIECCDLETGECLSCGS